MEGGASGAGIGQHAARVVDLERGHVNVSATHPNLSMEADHVMQQKDRKRDTAGNGNVRQVRFNLPVFLAESFRDFIP